VAVEEPPDGAMTSGALDALSDRLRDRLWALGLGPVARVGLSFRKSSDAVPPSSAS